jgi:hypothetical protein
MSFSPIAFPLFDWVRNKRGSVERQLCHFYLCQIFVILRLNKNREIENPGMREFYFEHTVEGGQDGRIVLTLL